MAANSARERFFTDIVEAGIASGEVRRDDAELLQEFIRLVLVGLTDGSSDTLEQQRRAIDSIMAVVRGELVRPVPEPDAVALARVTRVAADFARGVAQIDR